MNWDSRFYRKQREMGFEECFFEFVLVDDVMAVCGGGWARVSLEGGVGGAGWVRVRVSD